jgi:uncharacterized protein (DUF1697 family)
MAASERCFVFLRAINTGGRRVTNDELLAPFSALGFDEVAAYQAAGNIALRTTSLDALHHALLDPVIADAYGFDAPSFVRSHAQSSSIVDSQPFSPGELDATEGRIQVALLRDAPSDETLDVLADLVPADDRVVVLADTLYWLPAAGISGSKLPVASIERLLGPMTIRTLGTLERLLAKFAA